MQKTDTLSHSRKISCCRVIELGAGGWGVGSWKVARIQNVVVSRWQYDMSPRRGGNTFFFFFLNWDMFPRGRNVRDHKIKDSASKVLQGAVKECFGWRLVQASSHFQPPLRENAPGETTKSERAVFKSPHSRRPGCGLVTVKSSAAIPKISPPPPGTGTRCKTSSGGFRRENPTVERHDWDVKGVKYIRIRKRKRTKRPGWEWLRGRELRLNRQNHPHHRTKWNADHQSSHKKPHLLEIQRWDAHLP